MKYLFQMMVIGAVTFAGEVLNYLLPFPIPASVYGMVLMFTGLMTGIIKEEQIKETAGWLLLVMPVIFIGPGVEIIEYFTGLSGSIWAFFLVVFVSTVIVMAVTGLTAQGIAALVKRRGNTDE